MERKEEVFPEEKRDGLDVSDLPPSFFGMTLADAEEYGRKLERGDVLRFHNAPVRDVTKETYCEFMSTPLPEEDNEEIKEAMNAIAEVFG